MPRQQQQQQQLSLQYSDRMGNSCGNGASARRRVCLMERHTLSEDQMAKLEEMFKKAGKGKRYISFKEFIELYPESQLRREESDMRSVYYAFSDARTNCLKFDGFVRLMMLSNRVGSVEEAERIQALFDVMDPAGCRCVPRAEFRRFVRSFVADDKAETASEALAASGVQVRVEDSNGHAVAVESTDGTPQTQDSQLLGFEEFNEFCTNEKNAYSAICAYIFPM